MDKKKSQAGNKTFLKSPWVLLLGSIVGIGLITVVIALIVDFSLSSYTHHGESLILPDFKGMSMREATRLCDEKNIRYLVKDTSYSPNISKDGIIEQNPKAGQRVKEGRRIYFTINGRNAPLVKMPDIIDNQQRVAIKRLESEGLVADEEVEYKPDEALNAVLGMTVNGRIVRAGEKLPKGTVIKLVLGDGLQSPKVALPKLTGKKFEEAVLLIKESSLNLGVIRNEEGHQLIMAEPTDIITKQDPAVQSEKSEISQGSSINLWIRKQ